MTKLNWSKARIDRVSTLAPVGVVDHGAWSYNDNHPFKPKPLRAAEAAKERVERAARSEAIQHRAIIKKFGEDKALELGVPRELVEAAQRAEIRGQQRAKKRRPA